MENAPENKISNVVDDNSGGDNSIQLQIAGKKQVWYNEQNALHIAFFIPFLELCAHWEITHKYTL